MSSCKAALKPCPPTPIREMPDIAHAAAIGVSGALDRVGMSHIELPVLIEDARGRLIQTPAVADAFVNLADETAKGIHMSRLFLALQEVLEDEALSPAALAHILTRFMASHEDLSTEAAVALRFDWMVKRRALVSDNTGWRRYPMVMRAHRFQGENGPETQVFLGTTVLYSSTCPCSAALARQLIQEAFDRDFGTGEAVNAEAVRAWLGTEDAIRATPHSQRSEADVLVRLGPDAELGFGALVDLVEGSLKTVVQAAVKREDEQAFALLNGQNLMFCEDAARRVKTALDGSDAVADYRIQCTHRESLHPHDAVAVVTAGVEGGLTA